MLTKRTLYEYAYAEIGLGGDDLPNTPEEVSAALLRLEALMADLLAQGLDAAYLFASSVPLPADDSGLPLSDLQPIASYLALRLAPLFGITLSAETRAALMRSFTLWQARHVKIPTMQMPGNVPRGAGSWWNTTLFPFTPRADG